MRLTVQQWLESSESSRKSPHLPFNHEGNIAFGNVLYSVEQNTIKIRIGGDSDDTYDMNVDRILSGQGLLDFIFQIHHKEWCTGQHIKDLLDCITCYAYREHGQFPQKFFDVANGMNSGLDSF